MWRWCSQIASDYTEFSFNPLRLVSAPPPPAPPLVLRVVLIATLVNPAHGTQGCPKIISFDKNYWHPSFQLTLFNLLSLYCSIPAHFSQHSLPEKMHLLFSANHQSDNPFSRFLLFSKFLLFLNKHANYSCRRIWNLPVNPARHVPGFMEEKGR